MLENLSESFHHVWLYLGCYLHLNKNKNYSREHISKNLIEEMMMVVVKNLY